MKLSIFTDELNQSDVLRTLDILHGWGLRHVDFRGMVFGKGIDALSKEELRRLKRKLDSLDMSVTCLQSSLAKIHLPGTMERAREEEKLEGLLRAADVLECRLVRSFNYWQPAKEQEGELAQRPDVLQKVLDAFEPLHRRAKAGGLTLGFENCGQSPAEVLAFLDALDEPGWGLAWDVFNTWGEPMMVRDEAAYLIRLAKRSNMVHVKAQSIVPELRTKAIDWSRVLAVCAAAGLEGPVSVETHNPSDSLLSPEAASEACVRLVRGAWPSAAPGDIEKAARPTVAQVTRSWADRPVGFVVVGLGMGKNRAEELARTSGCRLVGVCDIDATRAKETGEYLGVPFTTDLAPWLRDPAVEAVFVLTETGRHGEVAIRALEAGRHVITTKPMEAHLGACLEMIRTARARERLLAVDFSHRLEPEMLALRKELEAGSLGRILHASARLRVKRTDAYYRDRGGWRGTWALDGGGTFSNQCIHHLDDLIHLLGVPESVRGSIHTLHHDIEAEDLGFGEWAYANGTVVHVSSTTCWPSDGWDFELELCGTEGAAVYAGGGPLGAGLRLHRGGRWIEASPLETKSTWMNSADNLAAAIREGAPLFCDGESGAQSRLVLDGMYASARRHGGAFVRLEEIRREAARELAASR